MRLPRLALLPTFVREIVGRDRFPRQPEPRLIMDDPEQVAAFSNGGRGTTALAASYLFHTGRICQTIRGCRRVLDLGCGPATQLAQVAALNPDTQFIGVDLSEPMLDDARLHVEALKLANIQLLHEDIARLDALPDRSVDGVISTLTLHHLPNVEALCACFGAIKRVLKPGGALYLADFGRLKSLKSVKFFAYMNERFQPPIFSLDYELSLRAAFQKEDYQRALAQLPEQPRLVTTFKVPFMVILKTPDRPLPNEIASRLRAMREQLADRYRDDLDDLTFFFRLGGLSKGPM